MDLPDLHRYIPFLGLMAHDQRSRPFATRLIEQSLPGIVVAAIGIYVSDARQTEQIAALKSEVRQVREDLQDMRRDLYIPRASQSEGRPR